MKYIVLIALQFSALFIYAQGHVEGKINDQKGLPLIGANIVLENTSTGTTTDANGKFHLDFNGEFPFDIKVSFIGFQSKNVTVKDNSFLTVSLSESIEIEEVTVESKVSTTELSMVNPLQVQKISSKELQKAACCNLAESFETNATVDINFIDAITGARKIQMLGLDGVYTQITQENLPLIRGLGSAYGLTYTPGSWINKIQLSKGVGLFIISTKEGLLTNHLCLKRKIGGAALCYLI